MSDEIANLFYVYAYYRDDGTPYYIGKGKGKRAWTKGKNEVKPPKDKSKIIIIADQLLNMGALILERRLIKWYGRKDNGTGILRNKTDGGEGNVGAIFTEERNLKISNSKKGKPRSDATREKIGTTRKDKSLSVGEKNGMWGKNHTEKVRIESSLRRAKTNSERKWFNNGIESKFVKNCPVGWTAGRINQKPTNTGKRYYNNGVKNLLTSSDPGPNWTRGMLPR